MNDLEIDWLLHYGKPINLMIVVCEFFIVNYVYGIFSFDSFAPCIMITRVLTYV